MSSCIYIFFCNFMIFVFVRVPLNKELQNKAWELTKLFNLYVLDVVEFECHWCSKQKMFIFSWAEFQFEHTIGKAIEEWLVCAKRL